MISKEHSFALSRPHISLLNWESSAGGVSEIFFSFFFCTWFWLLLPRHDALKLTQRHKDTLKLLGQISCLKTEGCLSSRGKQQPSGFSNCFLGSLAPCSLEEILVKWPWGLCLQLLKNPYLLVIQMDPPWRKTWTILLIKDWMLFALASP